MTDLEDYRKELDAIDQELVALFEKRMHISQAIGNYKLVHDLPIFDEGREQRVVEKNLTHLKSEEFAGADPSFLGYDHGSFEGSPKGCPGSFE